MKTKFFILLMILLSCEEIPTPGGGDSGCTGVYDLTPYSEGQDINLIHDLEE